MHAGARTGVQDPGLLFLLRPRGESTPRQAPARGPPPKYVLAWSALLPSTGHWRGSLGRDFAGPEEGGVGVQQVRGSRPLVQTRLQEALPPWPLRAVCTCKQNGNALFPTLLLTPALASAQSTQPVPEQQAPALQDKPTHVSGSGAGSRERLV